MSIALESATVSRIERPGLHRGNVFDSPEAGRSIFGIFRGDHRLSVEEGSSSSSSIGENSDGSGGPHSDGERDSGEGEVQSSFKGPLDALEVLEEVLPIKKGVSKFYNGKSKSYTSLEVAACSSIKDIVKPENAFTRKRKNLLAHSIFFDKKRERPCKMSEGGLLKKPANGNHMGLTGRMSGSGVHSPTPVPSRPPLHPQSRKPNKSLPSDPPSFSPWRSFSLSDLNFVGDMNSTVTCSDMNNNDNAKIRALPPNSVEE